MPDVYVRTLSNKFKANFYRQIRNLAIDVQLAKLSGIMGIHWQVAQATSIDNVNIIMTDKSNSTQIGICRCHHNTTSECLSHNIH